MELKPDHRKLEQIVTGILKSSDLELATELSVRNEAEKLLGIEISDLASKRLIRRIVESFLLSTSPSDEVREETVLSEEVQNEKLPVNDRNNGSDDGAGRIICRDSMAIPRLVPASDLLAQHHYLPTDSNNFRFNPDEFECEHPIIVDILKHHYISYSLSVSPSVALVYVQQLWHTLHISEVNNVQAFVGNVDNFEISITLPMLRDMLRLRNRHEFSGRQDFEEIPPNSIIYKEIRSLGYSGALNKTSDFKRKFMAPIWFTLFSILNRCITPKKTGMDNASITTLRFFTGIAFHRHYDYAALIWEDLKEVILAKSTQKARNFIPFQRFFQVIIQHFLQQERYIPRRSQEPRFPITEIKYLKVGGGDINVQSAPLPEGLLSYARSARIIQNYRNSLAPMVLLEPTGPSQRALDQTGEGLDIGEGILGESVDYMNEPEHIHSDNESDRSISYISDTSNDDNDNDKDDDNDVDAMTPLQPIVRQTSLVEYTVDVANLLMQLNRTERNLKASEGGVGNVEGVYVRKEIRSNEQKDEPTLRTEHHAASFTNRRYPLTSGIEEDTICPITQAQTPQRHSRSFQHERVSYLHGDLAHPLSTSHLENVDIEAEGSLPQPSPSIFAQSSLEPHDHITNRTLESITDPCGDVQITCLRDNVIRTTVGVSQSDIPRGSVGNPATVIIMPAVNAGHAVPSYVDSTVMSTSNLSDLDQVSLPITRTFQRRTKISRQLPTFQLYTSHDDQFIQRPGKQILIESSSQRSHARRSQQIRSNHGITINPSIVDTPVIASTVVTTSVVVATTVVDTPVIYSSLCQEKHVNDLTTAELQSLLLSRLSSQDIITTTEANVIDALQQLLHPPQVTFEFLHEQMLVEMQKLTDKYKSLSSTCRAQSKANKRRHQDRDDQDPDMGEKRKRLNEIQVGENVGDQSNAQGRM